MDEHKIGLSIVITVFNEENNLLSLYTSIKESLKLIRCPYEIIFIDDGSTDASAKVLREIKNNDNSVLLISFLKNYGQTKAQAAGFDYAKGELIITMDSDCQNDPADIIKLLDKLNAGYDMVVGWRKRRQDPLFSKRLLSFIGNIIIRLIFGLKVHDVGCTMKVFRKDVVQNITLFGEMHRFIPLLAQEKGYRVTEEVVNHLARKSGKSHYGFQRLPRAILDLSTFWISKNTSQGPIRFLGKTGIFNKIITYRNSLAYEIKDIYE